jgi:outer membrane lipoprotein carrier protein
VPYVYRYVTRIFIGIAVACLLPAAEDDADLKRILKGVQDRYNNAKTLAVNFAETYSQGAGRRTETGHLTLRKPGRMRWDYTQPAGKLFVSDGRFVYLYSPHTNRVEKMRLKETEDMRAPMAFLLGRLDFSNDFKDFKMQTVAGTRVITALPKSDRMPYTKVNFTVGPNYEIRKLVVTGQDKSVLEFHFSNEQINPPVNDAAFNFKAPPDVPVIDSSSQE